MEDTTTTDTGELRSFTQILANIAGGELHDRLTRDVNDLIAEIQQAQMDGRKARGKMVLTLDFAADGRMVRVEPAVKIDTPKPAALESSHFFVTAKNGLSLNDPKQLRMSFKDVNGARDINAAKAV